MQAERKCKGCGATLPPQNPRGGRSRVWCSRACMREHREVDAELDRARRQKYKVEAVCVDCGKVRHLDPSRKIPPYCKACSYRHRFPVFAVEIPGLLPIYDEHGACDFARVDFDDWERFRHLRLTMKANKYPAARVGAKKTSEYLHRLILGLQPLGGRHAPRKHAQTDHINRDPTDNRKANLRVVTAKENCANRGGRFAKAA